MFSKYNTTGQILKDVKKGFKGKTKDVKWKDYKISSIDLADSYKRLGNKKYLTVADCGNVLEFKRFKKDNSLKLHMANFCKVRLCPMCSWRRSLKIFGQVSKVMDVAVTNNDYRFVFLTLTCKNIYGDYLSSTIDNLLKAFEKLSRRTNIKKFVKGWFRALEVTHNTDPNSMNFDTYHPHFHVILAVNKSYFTDSDLYLSHSEWVKMWKDCLCVDYVPIVDLRVFKTSKKQMAKSVSETAKYTVKAGDFIIKDKDGVVDQDSTDMAVAILDKALAGRRLTAFGGDLKKIHKKLNLDDAENGDLVNTDNDEDLRDDLDYVIEKYRWHVGYSNYLEVLESE